MVGHGLDHIIKDVAVADVARHHVPEVSAPGRVDGPATGNLTDDLVPVPLFPALRGCDIIGQHFIAVGCERPFVGFVNDVVHVRQPGIDFVAVFKHHFGGELGVGLFVEIVRARCCECGCEQPSCKVYCYFNLFHISCNVLEVNVNTKHNGTIHRVAQTVVCTQLGIPEFER